MKDGNQVPLLNHLDAWDLSRRGDIDMSELGAVRRRPQKARMEQTRLADVTRKLGFARNLFNRISS